jgi:citron Rho-interacting kinase
LIPFRPIPYLLDFLDDSDPSLNYVKATCKSATNYPVAILDLGTDPNTQETEYLICFSNVGIFLDSFGRRSREAEIVFSKLPIAAGISCIYTEYGILP